MTDHTELLASLDALREVISWGGVVPASYVQRCHAACEVFLEADRIAVRELTDSILSAIYATPTREPTP